MVGDDGVDPRAAAAQIIRQQELLGADVYAHEDGVEFGVLRPVHNAHVAVGIVEALLVEVRLAPVRQRSILLPPLFKLAVEGFPPSWVYFTADFDGCCVEFA